MSEVKIGTLENAEPRGPSGADRVALDKIEPSFLAARSENEERFLSGWSGMVTIVNRCAIEHGWWDDELVKGERRNDAEMLMLMVSELGEAMEGLRKPHQDEHCPDFTSVEVELADCVIRIMDMAKQRNYRLAEAIVAKAEYNESRPYKHGGKKF